MKKSDFIVFGADGMQGSIVARYLLERGYSVFAADIFKSRIQNILRQHKKKAIFQFVDLKDIERTMGVIQTSGADIVINCAEGDWNLNVYQACLSTRRHVIDLGSHIDMTIEQLKLNREFEAIGRTAITGCGSVPGIGNVMLAHVAKKFDSINSIDVGFAWDSNIKRFVVPFSISSVLEEFTMKAPYIKNVRIHRILPADSETVRYFRGIGPQKIFLVDHPEIYTFYYYFKKMGVENIRFFAGFPEHSVKVIKTLIDLTFSDQQQIEYQGQKIVPVEFLTQVLKRMKLPRGYKEWENLWVEVKGRSQKKKKTVLMECIVPPLRGWEEAGCNIDTGFPAAIIAEMIKNKEITKRGSFAPEAVVPEKKFFKRLRKHKFVFYENGERLRL